MDPVPAILSLSIDAVLRQIESTADPANLRALAGELRHAHGHVLGRGSFSLRATKPEVDPGVASSFAAALLAAAQRCERRAAEVGGTPIVRTLPLKRMSDIGVVR